MLYLPLALAWLTAVSATNTNTPAPTPGPTPKPFVPSGNVSTECVKEYGQLYSKISECDDIADTEAFPTPQCLIVALGNIGATTARMTLQQRCNDASYGYDVFVFWMYSCALGNDQYCPERLWDKDTTPPDTAPFLEGPEVVKARTAFQEGVAAVTGQPPVRMVWQSTDNQGKPVGKAYDQLPGCATAKGVKLNLPQRVKFWFSNTPSPTTTPAPTDASPTPEPTPAPTDPDATASPTVDPYADLYTATGKAFIECDENANVLAVNMFIEKRSLNEYFEVGPAFWTNLVDLSLMTKLRVTNVGLSHEDSDGMMPEDIYALTQLVELDLSENAIQTVDDRIDQLTALQTLDLSFNSLEQNYTPGASGSPGLPTTINQLKMLEYLDVSHNQLKELPETIGELEKLANLFIGHNKLTAFPNGMSFDMWGKSLLALNMKYNEMTALPDGLNSLTKLAELSMTGNLITALPTNVTGMASLQVLDISNNKLQVLPDSMADLDELVWLTVSYNELQEIPDAVGDMERLTALVANNNQIQVVTEDLGNLKNLYKVELQYNFLTTFPNVISDMDRLWYLDLNHNNLLDLPDFKSDTLVHADIRQNLNLRCVPFLGNNPPEGKQWTLGMVVNGYSFWADHPDIGFCNSYTSFPTVMPTNYPSIEPSLSPTFKPGGPTEQPSPRPTEPPTRAPVQAPTDSGSASASLWTALLLAPIAALAHLNMQL